MDASPDDNTPGGDLEVYRWKDPGRKRFVAKQPDPSAVELVDIVRYKPNTMVLFVNSQDSLHAVSPRLPSGHTRRLVNIIGEVDQSYPAGLYTEPRSSVKDYLRRKLSIFKP